MFAGALEILISIFPFANRLSYMQYGDQEVKRVYVKIAYEFNVISHHLQCKQTRSKADFTGVLARFRI